MVSTVPTVTLRCYGPPLRSQWTNDMIRVTLRCFLVCMLKINIPSNVSQCPACWVINNYQWLSCHCINIPLGLEFSYRLTSFLAFGLAVKLSVTDAPSHVQMPMPRIWDRRGSCTFPACDLSNDSKISRKKTHKSCDSLHALGISLQNNSGSGTPSSGPTKPLALGSVWKPKWDTNRWWHGKYWKNWRHTGINSQRQRKLKGLSTVLGCSPFYLPEWLSSLSRLWRCVSVVLMLYLAVLSSTYLREATGQNGSEKTR